LAIFAYISPPGRAHTPKPLCNHWVTVRSWASGQERRAAPSWLRALSSASPPRPSPTGRAARAALFSASPVSTSRNRCTEPMWRDRPARAFAAYAGTVIAPAGVSSSAACTGLPTPGSVAPGQPSTSRQTEAMGGFRLVSPQGSPARERRARFSSARVIGPRR